MKRLLTLLALLLPVVAGAQSLTITHLSETHSMVQVSGHDRYILLPVQETAQEAVVKVLSNGTVVLKANVSLGFRWTWASGTAAASCWTSPCGRAAACAGILRTMCAGAR